MSPGLEQLHFYCIRSAMLENHVNLFPGQLWLSQNGNKARISDSGVGATKQMFIISSEERSGLTILFLSLVR